MHLYDSRTQAMERRQRAERFIDTNLALAGGKDADAHYRALLKD